MSQPRLSCQTFVPPRYANGTYLVPRREGYKLAGGGKKEGEKGERRVTRGVMKSADLLLALKFEELQQRQQYCGLTPMSIADS